jgi:tRNA A37 threonylcarbamoyladenosine biosynthesis protein TsaE
MMVFRRLVSASRAAATISVGKRADLVLLDANPGAGKTHLKSAIVGDHGKMPAYISSNALIASASLGNSLSITAHTIRD